MDALIGLLDEYKLYFGAGVFIGGVIWGLLSVRKLLRSKVQSQRSGAHSVNVQGGRDVKLGSSDNGTREE
jgi:hypothetical protein